MKYKISVSFLLILFIPFFRVYSQFDTESHLIASKEEVIFYTSDWNGERLPDGRPKVSDDLLERLKHIKIEDAWQYLYEMGYHNQYEGGWKKIHEDVPMVGRALTTVYMPERPDIKEKLVNEGTQAGYTGPMNTWPIELLQEDDIYLADSFGKIAQGTLIGSNLGNSIYAKSKNGVIFNGSLRDAEDLEELEGFNAFVRDWHPSFLEETMLMGINVPVRIGKVTVMPGDVVLAKKGGIVFIPPQLVETIVITAELVKLRDEFAQQKVREGVYTAGQIDTKWTSEIENAFLEWVKNGHMDRLPVSLDEMQKFLQQRTW